MNLEQQKLENFIILETLTSPEDGNHFQIYRCQHRTLNTQLFLKCIMASTILSIGDIATLESTALQKINSPNVIKIQSYFIQNQMHCLLLENCDSSLNDILIKNNFKLPEQLAIQYMLEIVNGVQAIHSAQLIHRDLQIKNIFVHQNKPKIVNFSWAKRIFDKSQSIMVAQLGVSAPECFSNLCVPSFEQDIFSLGSIFYILLTGSLPYDCSSAQNYITSIQNGILKIDSQIVSTVRESIINLITTMMHYQPQQRPTLNTIKNILCQAVNHEQIQIRRLNHISPIMLDTILWTPQKISQLANQILYIEITADEFTGKAFYNLLKIMFPRLMLYKRCYLELEELIKIVKSKNESNVFSSMIRPLDLRLQGIKQKLEQQILLCKNEPRLKYDDIQGWQSELNLIQNEEFYDFYEKAMNFLIAHMKRTEIAYIQSQNELARLQQMLVLLVHIQICSVNFDDNTQQEFEGANLRTIQQLKEIAKVQ